MRKVFTILLLLPLSTSCRYLSFLAPDPDPNQRTGGAALRQAQGRQPFRGHAPKNRGSRSRKSRQSARRCAKPLGGLLLPDPRFHQ